MLRVSFAIATAAGFMFAAAGACAGNPGTSKSGTPKPGTEVPSMQDPILPDNSSKKNSPAAVSALFIYQFIVNRLAFLEECAQVDKPNISAYSEAFSNFSLEATPIADRTFTILHEESVRAKESSDAFSRRMFDIGRVARKQLMANVEKNSMAFTIGCRMTPPAMREHAEGYRPIRSQFPDHMRVIDAWK